MNRAKHSLTIGYASLSRLLLENAQASLIRLCTNPSDPLADNCASPAHNQNCGDKKTATGETTCGPSHQARKPAPGSSAPLRSFSQRCSGSPNPAPDRLPSERFTPPLPRFCRNPIKIKGLGQEIPISTPLNKGLTPQILSKIFHFSPEILRHLSAGEAQMAKGVIVPDHSCDCPGIRRPDGDHRASLVVHWNRSARIPR